MAKLKRLLILFGAIALVAQSRTLHGDPVASGKDKTTTDIIITTDAKTG